MDFLRTLKKCRRRHHVRPTISAPPPPGSRRHVQRRIEDYSRRRWRRTENGLSQCREKSLVEQALVAHGWVALDPTDTGVIEKLFKKTSAREKKG
jgi:hypothetical protein